MLGARGGTFALAAQDGIQFSTKQQEETGEIHPGEQHDDGSKREVGRVVAIVTGDIKLEELGHGHPANGEEDRAGQGLPDGEIILRCQEVESERENDQSDGRKGEIEGGDPVWRGMRSWKLTSAMPARVSPKTVRLKARMMVIPNQKRRRNEIMYFDHQLRSSVTPWV